MYAYDNWKLSDPDDTPENDRKERIYEAVEEEFPQWTPDEIWEEVEARIRQYEDDRGEALYYAKLDRDY